MRNIHGWMVAASLFCALSVGCKKETAESTSEAPASGSSPTAAAPSPATDGSAAASNAGSSEDPALAEGRKGWKQANCGHCHGSDGSGKARGPDLTDADWVHCDGSVEGIRKVLVSGVSREQFVDPDRPFEMPPVTEEITDEKRIDALAAYVHSLSAGDE